MHKRSLGIVLAAVLAACGGDTFSSPGAGGSDGVGGSTGSGGASGISGATGSGGKTGTGGSDAGACTPTAGCASLTSCSDGCNTCSCFGGQWACTNRYCPPPVADATADAPTRSCQADQDCVFRADAGCCGMCLAVSDPVPASIPCGRMCFSHVGCACIEGKCATGTLPPGSACEMQHDLCGGGQRCCVPCGGVDGATCPSVCTTPATGGTCPKFG